MVNIYGINLFNFLNSYTKDVIIYVLNFFWFRYMCGYGRKDYQKNSTHIQFIKWRCLTSFSIKHLYTWPNVVEITIYHKAHTWTNGSFAHGEHDLESISCMSRYVPHMSQALKDHIWAQLNLGYMAKQMYDIHETIWWEHVNVDENMTWNDFIWLQDIAYLDQKHKKRCWRLHTNPVISIQSWVFQHSKDVFFFPRCWWNQWDLSPIHHRYSNTNSM